MEEKVKIKAQEPTIPPARVSDFEELDKKSIDTLVDVIKYIATTAGIVMAIYSQVLQDQLKTGALDSRPFGKLLIFSPLLLWFLTIVGTVIGIFPRQYEAATDLQKQNAVIYIRKRKRLWSVVVLVLFIMGFAFFLYVSTAQIWKLYPFS